WDTIFISKGPTIWEEEERFSQHYHRRYYQTKIDDVDGDGMKEVQFTFQKIAHYYSYKGNGRWQKL
ncbi:MAG: hypothetical protein HQK53_16700, partial [Oligoflexia bacterium]|nr:hypothetical protein [Oligoflexia bacterium]